MLSWLALIALVPLACGVIGYLTNVVAIRMIFRPYERRRVAGVPFQGVLPKHLEHFARQLAGILTSDFISVPDLVGQIQVEQLAEAIRPEVDRLFSALVEEILPTLGPGQRAMLSEEVLALVRGQAHEELSRWLSEHQEQICAEADQRLDLAALLTQRIVAYGPAALEANLRRIAGRELRFIELYGGIFGLLIGAGQATLMALWQLSWELPVIGAVVGVVTNYLAIKMLFYPREPWRLGPLRIQGLFPMRQSAIAQAQAEIVVEQLVVVDELLGLLFDGVELPSEPAALEAMLLKEVGRRYEGFEATLNALLTAKQRAGAFAATGRLLARFMPTIRQRALAAASAQIALEQLLADKIAKLPKVRFEELFRSLFNREEFYLVLYGGLLGALMGLAQLAALWVVR